MIKTPEIISKLISLGEEIDPDSLIRLRGVRTTSDEFGYLLRHYWIPATRLDYEYMYRQRDPQGIEYEEFASVRRTPLKIDAEKFIWTESSSPDGLLPGMLRFFDVPHSRDYCEYDRFRQTFHSRSAGMRETEQESRNQAFLRIPIMPPLLPIPVGFRWHVSNGAASLDFLLEAVKKVDRMTVLFIRRRGIFSLGHFYRFGKKHEQDVTIIREGVTAYSLERSVVLEDRTKDVCYCEPDPFGISGTTTLTVGQLVASTMPKELSLAPSFVKYRTESGQAYVYDCGTGRIIKFGETIYELLDDFRLSSREEVESKRPETAKETIRDVFDRLGEMNKYGYLHEHHPTEPGRIEIVKRGAKYFSLREFWEEHCSLLVLGLTERCNLNCSYCCYSGKFEGQRTHGQRVMSFDTAKKAISALVDRKLARGEKYPITFYGGEPLLEFELLKQCVDYAVEYAASQNKQVRFSITTNGTLLSDEVVDFLVEHRFMILVSLDGPKAAHDRYRVFSNGKGSFEKVFENLQRFAERHPDYKYRGINVTLAPPLDLEETTRFIDGLAADCPMIRAALVDVGDYSRLNDGESPSMRYGCSSCSSCEQGALADDESFRRFGDEDAGTLKEMWDDVVDGIAEFGAEATREKMPFAMGLFGSRIAHLHQRPVASAPPEWSFYVPCLPGFTRRFCDADGIYRICERVDHSDAYVVGDVENGLDPAKMERIMEMRRHFGDCGNCTAIKSCDICYARIPKSDAASTGYDPGFEFLCHQTRRMHEALLPVYTGIMERNRRAFDLPVGYGNDLPPEIPLQFGAPGSRVDDATLKILESESL